MTRHSSGLSTHHLIPVQIQWWAIYQVVWLGLGLVIPYWTDQYCTQTTPISDAPRCTQANLRFSVPYLYDTFSTMQRQPRLTSP